MEHPRAQCPECGAVVAVVELTHPPGATMAVCDVCGWEGPPQPQEVRDAA